MTRFASLIACGILIACGSSPGTPDDGGGDDDDDAGSVPDAFTGPYDDFPADPIIDGAGAPPGAPDLFGDPGTGDPTGGPCLIEPEVGTLFPRNWLRPRFSWVASGGQNLFELRLTAANETHPLVVYTTATTWTMPEAMWAGLSNHIIDAPITVTVRGAVWNGTTLTDGPSIGSTGDIMIAPVDAPGAIVYWTTTGGSAFRGFEIGDETVQDIIRPANAGAGVQCVGCHSSTPDGEFVGFSASTQAGNGDPAMLGLRSSDGTGGEPTFLTPSARTLMARQQQEQPVFSPLHWSNGDRIAVTMYSSNGSNPFQIVWTDLEATSTAEGVGWGIVARTGDAGEPGYASFAKTEDRLLYVTAPEVSSGVTMVNGDLATVPFNGGAGGAATTIPGANLPAYNEYYPQFSPDDDYIAFNRVMSGLSSYNNASAELFVIPSTGGDPVRLAANDPAACSGRTSPGVTNSWPKWAPDATISGARTFYWLTFSSTRRANNPQLYITPVVEENGALTTYPALYLWNQPSTENNHTPAWDNFDIPID